MQFTNIITNTLIILITALGIAFFMWALTKRRSTLAALTLAQHRHNRSHLHTPMQIVPRYHMIPATRDAIVDSMNDGMVIVDEQKRIVDINPAARRILQRPTVEIVGSHLGQVWPDLAQSFQTAATNPQNRVQIIHSGPYFYEITVTPFFDDLATQRGHMLSLRDVTERKKKEEMRDDMTRTMVHDLRDPISNSLFALEMLRTSLAGDDASEARQLLDLTFANTVKTLQMVDKILEIGRLESGEMPLSLTAVSLPDLVDNLLKAQTPRAAAKQLQLVNDLPTSMPLVWADAGLLERILKNLVDNSIKFTPNGGEVRVTAVHAPHSESNEPTLLISVTDTGPGIPVELMPQIFTRFVTGSHIESGSGLGLAFCKMALLAHGQNIWANNEPNAGATFTFSMPTTSASA